MMGKFSHRIGRRHAVFSFIGVVAAASGVISAMYSSVSFSQNSKKPSISQNELRQRIDAIVSGIYEDAKIAGFPLKEDYLQNVPKEIFPEVEFITQRRFRVEK